MTGARTVLRYLNGTRDHCLLYKQCSNDPQAAPVITLYSDADWGTCKETRRSTTGVIVMVNGNPVSWSTHRQHTVATSTMEAEYYAIAEAIRELLWYRSWLQETLGHRVTGVQLLCDNQAAIDSTKHEHSHARSKHIDIKYHFIRERVSDGTIVPTWIPTGKQLADVLTKKMKSRAAHEKAINQLLCCSEGRVDEYKSSQL